jgi:Helicase HerA, central domain
MKRFLEKIIARIWNRDATAGRKLPLATGLFLGWRVVDEAVTRAKVTIPIGRRATHIAVLGRTGTGKSSLIRWFCEQDIKAGRGFFVLDIHGELTPAILSLIAAEERRTGADFSERVIVIDPADNTHAVGLNPLEKRQGQDAFVRVSQFAEVLKERWSLHTFGARTDELLRNSLLVLAENDLTLLELGLLLADASFRAACLAKVTNVDVRDYFETRYGGASEAMQAVMREPILNKTSAFTADPHFRFIIGQRRSAFSVARAMDEGKWIIANLAKGTLGAEAVTLGALFLTIIRHAVFERSDRHLFTIFADEVQNFVGHGADLETMFAESRKFSVAICTANQYLEQLPQEVRAAILAIGTQICFQLSAPDAHFVAMALDGAKSLAERLKNLPPRHLILKSGSEPLAEVAVPEISEPHAAWQDLAKRSRERWAQPRTAIESDINERRGLGERAHGGDLDDWE